MNANPVPYIESTIQHVGNNINLYEMTLKDIVNLIVQKIGEFLNLPTADKVNSIDWSSVQSIFATITITLIITFLIGIVLWLMKAIGLYVAARNKGDKLAWLAFVPYGCYYAMGSIVSETKIFGIKISKCEFLLPALILSMLLPFVGGIASLLFILFYYGVLYRVYQELSSNLAIIFLVLSILIPVLPGIFLFFIRNGNSSKHDEKSKAKA